MSIPAVIFWVLALMALISPPLVAIFLFLGTAAFGALALVPPDIAAGTNILPQAMAAVILIIKVLMERRPRRIMINAAKDVRGYGLECLFVIFAVIAAFALPRLFAGRVYVVSMRTALETTQQLQPTVSNFAQAAYLALNLVAGLALFAFMVDDESGRRREWVLLGLLTGGAILAASGIVDLVSTYVPDLKDFVVSFKTAQYEVYSETTVMNVHRITGFFSEAAAFGAPAVGLGGLLYFIRPAFRSNIARTILCPMVSCTLIALAALSTSTTAYLGLAVFGVAVAGRLGYRVYKTGTIRGLGLDAVLCFLMVLIFVSIVIFAPEATRIPFAIVDKMVFQKMQSGSYTQRTFWNRAAMDAFYQSFGLGVGPGSARTSNWLVSLLSNTGVVGFALMMGFVAMGYMQRAIPGSRRAVELMAGAKYGFVVFLATEVASGTTIDPGFLLAITMALMIGPSVRAAQYVPARLSPRQPKRSNAARRESAVGSDVSLQPPA